MEEECIEMELEEFLKLVTIAVHGPGLFKVKHRSIYSKKKRTRKKYLKKYTSEIYHK